MLSNILNGKNFKLKRLDKKNSGIIKEELQNEEFSNDKEKEKEKGKVDSPRVMKQGKNELKRESKKESKKDQKCKPVNKKITTISKPNYIFIPTKEQFTQLILKAAGVSLKRHKEEKKLTN